MNNRSLNIFKQSTFLSVLFCTFGVGIVFDSMHALGVFVGGLYCMFSIWTYEKISSPALESEKSCKRLMIFLIPLKLIVIFSLVSAALSSPMAKVFAFIVLGVFMFIPGSIISAIYAWKNAGTQESGQEAEN